MNPAWDSPDLRVASDSARTTRFRLSRSWYRPPVLGGVAARTDGPTGREGLGDGRLRPQDTAARPSLNFRDPETAAHAEQRAVEVQREGGSLEPVRSSHPFPRSSESADPRT